MAKILQMVVAPGEESPRQIGRVHRDGSITFRGRTYASLGDLPPECKGLRPDVRTHCEWRALYRQIDPERLRRRRMSSQHPLVEE